MLQVKRHSLIVEYVVEKGCARVNELSRLFGVSPETIRRDLTALARNKKLVRSSDESPNDFGKNH
ncbi:DeoR family transcriptional regulator [Klebsiella oxytoca]|uniref:DeoR family transcriptional regulator n=1 Tax=Klebsiella oxytoca TaxID=571 RepID=UPI002594D7EA|nr:DeoR family transcriptional regulator [Klebsiella oxytoca]MDM4364682.1 DeoR family transcriptional regulator [Klebsiella oxytoca]